MKIAGIKDDGIPHQFLENGDLTFFDYPEMFDLEVGDLVQYKTVLGVGNYEVIDVRPAMIKQYPDRMRRVTAREKTNVEEAAPVAVRAG